MNKYTIGSIICLALAMVGAFAAASYYSAGNPVEGYQIVSFIYMIALPLYAYHLASTQIGRASCRGRVSSPV